MQIAIDVGRKSLVEALLLCVAIILESDEKKIGYMFTIQATSWLTNTKNPNDAPDENGGSVIQFMTQI